MAQRDPLVEYQREGFVMFQTMMEAIREESIRYLFNVEVQVSQPEVPEALKGLKDARGIVGGPVIQTPGLEAPEQPASLQFSAPNSQGQVETRVERTAAANPAQAASRKDTRSAGKKKRRK